MPKFILEQSNEEILSPHGGLIAIGRLLNSFTSLPKTARTLPKKRGLPAIELFRTYLGLIVQGKSDFEAVENVRRDDFFKYAMGIKQSPSSACLRQRFDDDARAMISLLDDANLEFLKHIDLPLPTLKTGHVPLDMDAFPMDNSGTQKEGVSYTYKGHDGYCPMASYLGPICLGLELRPGSQHAQLDFKHTLGRVVPRARQLTDQPILVRLDGAHDAAENRAYFYQNKLDFLIKWNPRKQDPLSWYQKAEQCKHTAWSNPRPGKRVALFSETLSDGNTKTRLVIQVTVRLCDAKGQYFLEPQFSLDGWLTSLTQDQCDNQTVIALYCDHATSEQYHSEFKTDLDLERLPSGKFDTNDLVLAFAVLAFNMLRYIGSATLLGPGAPIRHPAKRRRIKTVIQDIIHMACRLIRTGRQFVLRFGRNCCAYPVFSTFYQNTT